MRRSELERGVQNILEFITETSLDKFLREIMNSARKQEKGLDSKTKAVLLEVFRDITIRSQSFSRLEKDILKFFDLENLFEPHLWSAFSEGGYQQMSETSSAILQIKQFLPNFVDLLQQEYVQDVRNSPEDLPPQFQGKALLTVILPEEHGQVSNASRVIELIDSVNILYETYIEIHQEHYEPLILLACDSGSDKSFDFLGLAKAIEAIKEVVLTLWDRVIYFREKQYSERIKLVVETLPAIEKISGLEKEGKLGPEQAEKLRRQLVEGASKFLETGAITEEIYGEARFEPRQLMAAAPKLLTGTVEQVSETQPKLKRTVGVESDSELAFDGEETTNLSSLSAEEASMLKKLLEKIEIGKAQSTSNQSSYTSDDSPEPSI